MSIPLDQFSFNSTEAGDISMSFDSNLDDSPERWRFWLLRPTLEHLAAVCVEHRQRGTWRLTMRKVVPLWLEEPFECPVLRQSPP